MNETGEVIEVRDDLALVLFKRTSSCGHCHACGMRKDMNEVTVDVKNTLNAKVGDTVVLSFSSKQFLSSSFIVYVIPLIALIAGVFIGYMLGDSFRSLTRDVWAALFGLGLTALAFLGIRLFEPVFKKKIERTFSMESILNRNEVNKDDRDD